MIYSGGSLFALPGENSKKKFVGLGFVMSSVQRREDSLLEARLPIHGNQVADFGDPEARRATEEVARQQVVLQSVLEVEKATSERDIFVAFRWQLTVCGRRWRRNRIGLLRSMLSIHAATKREAASRLHNCGLLN
jgi:hypothetical protein